MAPIGTTRATEGAGDGSAAIVLILVLSCSLVHGQYFPTAVQAPSTAYTFWSGSVTDLDGNGVPDVLMDAISPTHALWRLPDVATGGVGQPLQLVANGAYAHAMGHIDSDAYPDLFLAINGQVNVALGLGNGMVGSPSNIGIWVNGPNYGVASLVPADLNGDGLDDLVVVTGYALGFGVYSWGFDSPCG